MSGTASSYTVDRWWFGNIVGKLTWGRNLGGQNGPGAIGGLPYCLGFQSSSAYTPAATEPFQIQQSIEADAVSDFAWGTASAQPLTLSFWAMSSLTGTFSGALVNYAATRGYPFNFTISAANSWQKFAITIPGDMGGTWAMSGAGGSVVVIFDLGSGANLRAAAGAWTNGNLTGATGAVRLISTNGATFYVTGVKLEIGTVATPYNRQSLAKSMADCQRYYQTIIASARGYNTNGAHLVATVTFPWMRAAPTSTVGTGSPIANSTVPALAVQNNNSAYFDINVTAVGDAYNFSAPCTLSAEL